jgi:hypothetical protein
MIHQHQIGCGGSHRSPDFQQLSLADQCGRVRLVAALDKLARDFGARGER